MSGYISPSVLKELRLRSPLGSQMLNFFKKSFLKFRARNATCCSANGTLNSAALFQLRSLNATLTLTSAELLRLRFFKSYCFYKNPAFVLLFLLCEKI